MSAKRLAIITARGGSKRIPGKNIKSFCGQPILAYSIQAAVTSGLFDTVMVSTDDEKIAEIAKQYGAEVPFYRSEQTSGDFATTNDVLLEVLEEYEKRLIIQAIDSTNSLTRAAEKLKITKQALNYKILKYGMKKGKE